MTVTEFPTAVTKNRRQTLNIIGDLADEMTSRVFTKMHRDWLADPSILPDGLMEFILEDRRVSVNGDGQITCIVVGTPDEIIGDFFIAHYTQRQHHLNHEEHDALDTDDEDDGGHVCYACTIDTMVAQTLSPFLKAAGYLETKDPVFAWLEHVIRHLPADVEMFVALDIWSEIGFEEWEPDEGFGIRVAMACCPNAALKQALADEGLTPIG